MYDNKKTTSFSMALYEYQQTIPSLYTTVLEYADAHKESIQPRTDPNTLWHFILNDDKTGYNGCHLWTNFQVHHQIFFFLLVLISVDLCV
jgi:alpha 1,2-mannosyltransferase